MRRQTPATPSFSRSGRLLRLELLEGRRLLTAAPYFEASVLHQVVPANGDGVTFAVDVGHPLGEAVQVTVSSDDPDIQTFIPEGNRFARMRFTESDGTPIGDIVAELFETRGGDAAARIIDLATNGYDNNGNVDPAADPFYTDVRVHRLLAGFVIQTGDKLNGNGTGGSPLGPFDDQFNLQQTLRFSGAGVLAMANAGQNSNDSQFFITDRPTPHLNFDSGNDSRHMVFGQVVTGMDVYKNVIGREVTDSTNGVPVDAPLLAGIEIFGNTQDATVTVSAGNGWDGEAALTITLTDESGETEEQTIDLVSRAFLGERPEVSEVDFLVRNGQTIALPSGADDGDLPVGGTVLFSGTDNEFQNSVQIDNESREIRIDTGGFSGLWPITLEPFELGYGGFVPTPGRQTHVAGTYNEGEPRLLSRVAMADSEAVTFATEKSGNLLITSNGDSGIEITDLTDPAKPVSLSTLSDLGQVRDVSVIGNTAIVAGTAGGLSSVDITDPAAPQLLDTLSRSDLGSIAVALVGDTTAQVAYVAGFAAGVIAVDVSDPSNLTVLQSVTAIDESTNIEEAVGITISGDRLFVADRVGMVVAVDTSTGSMVVEGSVSTGGDSSLPFGIDSDGSHIYVADLDSGVIVYDLQLNELGRAPLSGGAFQVTVDDGLLVVGGEDFFYFDASDPANLQQTSTFVAPSGAGESFVDGTNIYLAAGSLGVVLADAADAELRSRVDDGVLSIELEDGIDLQLTVESGNVKINGADPPSGVIRATDITGISIRGGIGNNTVDISAVTRIAFPAINLVEVDLGDGNDEFIGSELSERARGGPGSDLFVPGAGTDSLQGGSGDDIVSWSAGDGLDHFDGQVGADSAQVDGTTGNDVVGLGVVLDDLVLQFGDGTQHALSLVSVDNLNVEGKQGDDSFHVSNLGDEMPGLTVSLKGNEDADQFSVAVQSTYRIQLDLQGDSGADSFAADKLGPFLSMHGNDGLDEWLPKSAEIQVGELAASLRGIDVIDTFSLPAGSVEFDESSISTVSDAARLRIRAKASDELTPIGDTAIDTVVDGDPNPVFVLKLGAAFAEIETPRPLWTNPLNATDVSGNGSVEPLDVLLVINYLNANGSGRDLPSAPEVPAPFLDTNADGLSTPLDALLVINQLNSSASNGEGEKFATSDLPIGSSWLEDAVIAEDDEESENELDVIAVDAFWKQF